MRGSPEGSNLLYFARHYHGGRCKPRHSYRNRGNHRPWVCWDATGAPAPYLKGALRAAHTVMAADLCLSGLPSCRRASAGLVQPNPHLPVCSLVDRLRGWRRGYTGCTRWNTFRNLHPHPHSNRWDGDSQRRGKAPSKLVWPGDIAPVQRVVGQATLPRKPPRRAVSTLMAFLIAHRSLPREKWCSCGIPGPWKCKVFGS